MRFSRGRNFLFRIPEGEELLKFINEFAKKNNVLIGTVSAIGSLKNPKIGYFDEDAGEYKVIELTGTYELVSLAGNISVKDGEPFAHIHVALGDSDGMLYGGHLVEGEVFVAEVFMQELLGELLERKPQENGLALWDETSL
ncbi:PPC domain-containing DNA-binding protein [Thermococcus sp. 5-4]|uniref:PPC domain-containing DNA-binding protein n=1 Tax=Thermococcus sp. 5-4 TaxID=2008440 RepID=UPI000B4A4DD0|nr:PPC domain-containing DNA-binding protein [Thermococcus sp. 5-4]ASA77724.1 DNA-binding protein [Thermococcus sp. 5-4]